MPENTPSTKNTAVLILGMHRSGTSYLAGSLGDAGLELGETSNWNEHNHKGNRENRSFVNLNERILITNSGSWDNPPEQAIEWNERQSSRAQKLISAFQSSAIWGFKDPRTLLLLDGWSTLLPEVQHIGIFRNPSAVALSLHKRNHFPPDKGLALWNHYNRAMLAAYTDNAFPIISFDLSAHQLQENINRLKQEIGLCSNQEKESFFSADLVNQTDNEPLALPKETRQLFATLKEIAY